MTTAICGREEGERREGRAEREERLRCHCVVPSLAHCPVTACSRTLPLAHHPLVQTPRLSNMNTTNPQCEHHSPTHSHRQQPSRYNGTGGRRAAGNVASPRRHPPPHRLGGDVDTEGQRRGVAIGLQQGAGCDGSEERRGAGRRAVGSEGRGWGRVGGSGAGVVEEEIGGWSRVG